MLDFLRYLDKICPIEKIELPLERYVIETGEYRGYKWKILRHYALYHRCGYVRIPENHKLYNVHYSEFSDTDDFPFVENMGGITFSRKMHDGYWIGFDCGHGWQSSDPELGGVNDGGTIITQEMCKEIIKELIDGLSNIL